MSGRSPRDFYRCEATGGILAITAFLVALILANTSLAPLYEALRSLTVPLAFGDFGADRPLFALVGDVVLALAFLVYGLVIRVNDPAGDKSLAARYLTPAMIGAGAVLVPAILLSALLGNAADGGVLNANIGWIIPAGTDLALVMTVLAMLGGRINDAMRGFIVKVVVLGGIVAIVALGVVKFDALDDVSIAGLSIGLVILLAFKLRHLKTGWPVLLVGGLLWIVLQPSGFHAALAGVITASLLPHDPDGADRSSPANAVIRRLHPTLVMALLPLLVFFNAGIDFSVISQSDATAPIALSMPLALLVAFALFAGKQIGVYLAGLFAVGLGYDREMFGKNHRLLYGLAVLTGVGVTLNLAFTNFADLAPGVDASVRLGLVTGSLASALLGAIVLAGLGKTAAGPGQLALVVLGPLAGASLILMMVFPGFAELSRSANNFIGLALICVFAGSVAWIVAIARRPTGGPPIHRPAAASKAAPATTATTARPAAAPQPASDPVSDPVSDIVGPDTDLTKLDFAEVQGL